MEKRYFHKDGSILWINLTASLVMTDDGRPDYFIAAIENISTRKKLSQQLMHERNLARKYLDVAGVMIVALDFDGRITLINKRGLDILGYEENELLHKNWFDICLPTEVKEKVQAVFNRLMLGGLEIVNYYENPVVTRAGENRIVAFHNALLTDDQGNITGLISSGEDVTERKVAAEKLLKLSQAVEQSGEAVMITDVDGAIEYINNAFSLITGYSREEVIGRNPRILKSGEHGFAHYEAMWERLSSGKVWQGRVIDKRKDGTLYPAMVTISPLKNEDGVTTHYVGVQQSLKKYEDLERQFHQSQKMEAIGTLVGGIAHDFNNSLAGIISNLYLARRHCTDPKTIKRVENAEQLSFSAAAVIRQLLTFSRKGSVSMGLVSMASFLKEVVKLNRVSVPENIIINLDVLEEGLKIKGDVNQLQQVIMNLINNARDAVEHVANPEITISMHAKPAESDEQAAFPKLKNRELICIAVEDNGCGIRQADQEHIFEPFFTTKEQGKGTGLGLAMVFGAVKTHNGWIFSKPGKDGSGTVMKIYLPVDKSGGDLATSQLADDLIVEGKGETILLVDDNEMVLDVGREVLEGLNYQVISAKDGLEAVEIYGEKGAGIDMLLLDVVMPRLGGMEALKQIRQMNPDVKALFATGYNKAVATDSHEFKSERIISKPFAISELSQEIRNKLNS
ncbi:MAG: hypothetical protein AUJ57_02020 [Zetaproteobacteria bacterium CG1_02_53_45]|nr:MAG: hypothetical protein AUJ57_02020 [Zetaproteobacteria bacterium CG1_02_53_45]